ncbi:MAG: dephospho-CoA kinase [Planctomycetota bacterium]
MNAGACTVIGILGGIGSGKSTVAQMLAEMGAEVLDADAICTELHRCPEVKQAVRQRWGDGVFDAGGELDRAKLAGIVFDSADELNELDRIMHPKVVERISNQVAGCRDGGRVMCVIDAPLLLESGLIDLCDVTVFVDCGPAARRRRLARTRGWAADEIERREARQEPLARKREVADFVVENGGDPAATRQCIEEIVAHLNPSGDE